MDDGDKEREGRSRRSSYYLSAAIKYMDENVRYIQYPMYALGVVGIILVARSLRLAKKFTNPKSIPKEFIRKNFTLYGTVEQVKKYDGTTEQPLVVYVDHLPIFSRKKKQKGHVDVKKTALNKCLQVSVPGVLLNSKYYPQMLQKLTGKTVAFTMLEVDQESETLRSLLFVRTVTLKVFRSYENIGLWSVQHGYASTTPIPYPSMLRESKKFMEYYEKLIILENRAVRKGKGIWKDEDSGIMKLPGRLVAKVKTFLSGFLKWKK